MVYNSSTECFITVDELIAKQTPLFSRALRLDMSILLLLALCLLLLTPSCSVLKNHVNHHKVCKVCGLTFTKPGPWEDHINGKRHAEALKSYVEPTVLFEEFKRTAPSWTLPQNQLIVDEMELTADDVAITWNNKELTSLRLKSRESTLHPSLMISQCSPYQKARIWRYLRQAMGKDHYTELTSIVHEVDVVTQGKVRVKEIFESFETYKILENFVVNAQRTRTRASLPAINEVYELACGHGLVSLLLAYRFPKIQFHLYDISKRNAFRIWCDAWEKHGFKANPEKDAKVLSNIQFYEKDLICAKDAIHVNSLVIAIHACNDLNEKAIKMAISKKAAWSVMPCCISKDLYLGETAQFIVSDDQRDLRHSLMLGGMAQKYKAELIQEIPRSITNRPIMLSGGCIYNSDDSADSSDKKNIDNVETVDSIEKHVMRTLIMS